MMIIVLGAFTQLSVSEVMNSDLKRLERVESLVHRQSRLAGKTSAYNLPTGAGKKRIPFIIYNQV